MKEFIMALCLAFAVNNSSCYAQSVVKNGNTFSVSSTKSSHKTDSIKTKYFYETTTGKYPICINKKSGSCYYWCKSKAGKMYKRYCPTEVSAQVAKEYGIEYKPKAKK